MHFKKIVILFWLTPALFAGVWSEPKCVDTSYLVHTLTEDNGSSIWCIGLPLVLRLQEGGTDWEVMGEGISLGWSDVFNPGCFDKGDTLWVLGGNEGTYYIRYDGQEWGNKDTVPTDPGGASGYITADSTDGVWVGWTTRWWGWFDGAYNRYRNGNWDEPQVLTDTLEAADHVIQGMTTDAYGRVWVVWLNHYDVNHEPYESLESVYYNGNSWSEEILISSSDIDEGEFFGLRPSTFDLASDDAGGVWAVWGFARAEEWRSFIHASYWNGECWSVVDTIAQAGDFYRDFPPTVGVTVDRNGNAWAVWRQALEDNDKYGDIYYSVNTGSGWSEPAPVNEHPAVDQYPDIAVDGENRIWCVWGSNREDGGIWASYATSSGISEPVPVTHQQILRVDRNVGRHFTFQISPQVKDAELSIYDATGKLVRELSTAGNQVITWNGMDSQGLLLPPGVYFAQVSRGPALKLVLVP